MGREEEGMEGTSSLSRDTSWLHPPGRGHLDGAGLLRLGGAHGAGGVGVLARREAEALVVDGAELEEEEEQEDRACDHVEDAVPDHLGRRGDDVGALGERPADRVREEHEGEEARGEHVARLERAAGREGRARAVHQEGVPGDGMSTIVHAEGEMNAHQT